MNVTLDDDLAKKLKLLAKERGITFSGAVNETARAGLATNRRPFVVHSRPMGARVDLTKALQLVGDLEDGEIIRKMRQGR